jgi:hypothetical protein
MEHQGGCLCGNIRFCVTAAPRRVTFCHCRFCQKVTGAAYAVEPIFAVGDFRLLSGAPKTFDTRSKGSGKTVTVHFCDTCGSSFRYTFQRFGDVTGILAGSFDDPDWFKWDASTAKHIFLESAQANTLLPAGLPLFMQHAMTAKDEPVTPIVLEAPTSVRDLG